MATAERAGRSAFQRALCFVGVRHACARPAARSISRPAVDDDTWMEDRPQWRNIRTVHAFGNNACVRHQRAAHRANRSDSDRRAQAGRVSPYDMRVDRHSADLALHRRHRLASVGHSFDDHEQHHHSRMVLAKAVRPAELANGGRVRDPGLGPITTLSSWLSIVLFRGACAGAFNAYPPSLASADARVRPVSPSAISHSPFALVEFRRALFRRELRRFARGMAWVAAVDRALLPFTDADQPAGELDRGAVEQRL